MGELTATPDEVMATFRELFPREYDVAMLTLTTRKQAERIAELEQQAKGPADA